MSTRNNLPERFKEQRLLLEHHCRSYDDGEEVMALSIASSIRVFLHDTCNSVSLLKHMEKKGGFFLSTYYTQPNEAVKLGLVRSINVGVKNGFEGEAKYWPLCDERHFPSPAESSLLSFEDWWKEKVFQSREHSLSRRDLILFVTNKDGGAHVDEKIDLRYDSFRKSWSGGSSLVGIKSRVVRGYDNIPTYPGIRQIGYELLHSPSFNES